MRIRFPAFSPIGIGPDSTSGPLAGILIMLAAVFVLATMDMFVKLLSADFSVPQILFFRAALALPLILVLAGLEGGVRALKTQRVVAHLVRGLTLVGAAGCIFYSLALMPIANVYAIFFAAPLFITLLAVPMLSETVGWRRLTAVAVGFGGVLIMVQPGALTDVAADAEGNTPGLGAIAPWIAIVGTVFYALAMIFVRQLARTETTAATTFYSTLTLAVIAGLFAIWDWRMPEGWEWALLGLLGILGSVGQWLLTLAFRIGPAAVVAPFDYSAMIWGVIFGYFIFGDLPGLTTWMGAAIIIASGLYILHRETMKRPADEPDNKAVDVRQDRPPGTMP